MRQAHLFNPLRVTDFLIEKDSIFATLNLDPDELKLYRNIYQHLNIDPPRPDLVIYLQASTEILLERINARGNRAERNMDKNYVNRLVDKYTEFFHHYESSPLLIVNSAAIDPVSNDKDYQELLSLILTSKQGRNYYNPLPEIL